MILKNEAHVIARCLSSVKPFIDYWVICDTGSTDNTEEVVRATMDGVPGEYHTHEWRDFGYNRTLAWELAQPHGSYTITLDADEEFMAPPGWKFPELKEDCYAVTMKYQDMQYPRPAIFSTKKKWHYECVLHEYAWCPEPFTRAVLPDVHIYVRPEGNRSRDTEKFKKDAAVLKKAMEDDPNGRHYLRYMFYLAQSYRDGGEPEKAYDVYCQRAEIKDGWYEERYYSAFMAGRCSEWLKKPDGEIIDWYLKAWEIMPNRIESLGHLAKYLRLKERFKSASLFAAAASNAPMPNVSLFLEAPWYQWKSKDEYAVSAYWSGDYSGSLNSSLAALKQAPLEQKERILSNIRHAMEKLGVTSLLSQPSTPPPEQPPPSTTP
jgi:glycosyltransferase involved in cell wall biosynthesis